MKKFLLTSFLILAGTIYGLAQCVTCDNSTATGENSSVIGINNQANAINSKIIGVNSIINGWHSIAIGNFNTIYQTAGNSIAIGMFTNTISAQSMVIGVGYDNNRRLSNNVQQSLMIGFNSDKPTFFVSRSSGYNKTGRIAIGNVVDENGQMDPQAKLHLRADAGEEAAVFIEPHTWEPRAGANLWLGNMYHGVSAEFDNGLVFHTRTAYLFNEGNIGIGVTEQPQYLLEINGTTSTKRLRIYDKENPPQKG
ncbi:MAG: hypothetical protein DRI87_09195, partial [Bacteroidetes bacterium]